MFIEVRNLDLEVASKESELERLFGRNVLNSLIEKAYFVKIPILVP